MNESNMKTEKIVIEFTPEEATLLAENLKRSVATAIKDVDQMKSIISCAYNGNGWKNDIQSISI